MQTYNQYIQLPGNTSSIKSILRRSSSFWIRKLHQSLKTKYIIHFQLLSCLKQHNNYGIRHNFTNLESSCLLESCDFMHKPKCREHLQNFLLDIVQRKINITTLPNTYSRIFHLLSCIVPHIMPNDNQLISMKIHNWKFEI